MFTNIPGVARGAGDITMPYRQITTAVMTYS